VVIGLLSYDLGRSISLNLRRPASRPRRDNFKERHNRKTIGIELGKYRSCLWDSIQRTGIENHALHFVRDGDSRSVVNESFVECIREVYSTTNDSECMKKVVETARHHLQQLVTGRPFKDLISEGGDFVVDLMLACT
jgi:hypothetical protein